MNGTPRLRSAYPSTPGSSRKNGLGSTSPRPASEASTPSKPAQANQNKDGDGPLVPLSILDAPTQRLSVSLFYFCLMLWRFYNYYKLVSDETESLWLFMKWVAIDGVFLFGLPELRIPWMEWSSTLMTFLFLFHAVLNAFLMFRIPVPLGAWLIFLTKIVYNRELAVSERRVKPEWITHNSSLILGKQIVHVLPEGSAILNPEQIAFCIDSPKSSVRLPLRINQTSPVSIELLRIDIDTNLNETIALSNKEIKTLKKQAENAVGKVGSNIPRVLQVPISKTGLYRLLRVEDESKIEVQRRISDTLVVKCPSASVKTVPEDKCLGDLSNFFFQVDATPPLKIKYSRRINSGESSHVSLNIHPDNLDSPLSRHGKSQTLIRYNPATSPDMQWARTQHIEIPVNETLGSSGTWAYSVDEIQDALGNVVIYSDSEDSVLQKQLRKELAQLFTVHELPGAQFTQCNLEAPLKVARGKAVNLPIALSGAGRSDASRYHITYTYHPEPGMAADGDVALVKQEEVILKGNSQGIKTSEPGLYGLKSVRSDYCAGEIKEPSSCLLQNPPEPDLTITSETIPDKCAGNSIGLLVDIDFIGTPPFTLTYNTRKAGGALTSTVKKFNQMRTQLELRPKEAGLYTYEFMEIHDSVYESRSLKHKNLVFEQDVRPPASAHFENLKSHKQACIKERSTFSVRLFGVKPWTLEYELLHGKNRKKYKIDDIQEEPYTLVTDVLEEGGEYHLSITSVTDNSGCKVLLDNDARIDVRHHRPEAAFGRLSGKRIKTALEGKTVALPVKLTGDPPWTLTYTKVGDPSETVVKLRNANDNIDVVTPGLYQLTKVHDRECPGTVDSTSSQFEVSWVERPSVELAETPEGTTQDGTVIKKAVCEGDQDAMELSFTGNPPFVVKYEVHIKPKRGSASLSRRKETAGLNKASIKMETSQAGSVEYKFTELGDEHYESDRRKFKPLKFLQTIHNRPSATFKDIGKSYSYCKEDEAGDEVIPVLLTGTPPFSLEIGIKRHSTAKPQIVPISNIMSNTYNFRIPRTVLDLGTHAITIFKVQDAQGCQRVTEFDSPSVQVNVVDIPGISPLEPATDFCVGDRISFMLAGSAPFNVYYTFNGKEQKAASSTTTFRRIAEKPGEFTITGISDKASTDSCRARVGITKVIHPMPSVRISKGSTAQVDIHEGGEAELTFDFAGTPPFEFTYTRSTNAEKGKKSVILETRNEVSQELSKTIKVSEEGTYEVVSIRDRYCGFSAQKAGQKLLMPK